MPLWAWVILGIAVVLLAAWLADRRARRRGHTPSAGVKDMYDDPALKDASPGLLKNRSPDGF